MGASFQMFITDGEATEAELKAKFKAHQDSERFEYGNNPYGGHLGLKQGLKILSGKTFPNLDEAEEWILNKNEKWGPADAVKFLHEDGTKHWLVGGWCPS